MGFLNNLLKRETRKIISSLADTVADSVADSVRQYSGSKDTDSHGSYSYDGDEKGCPYDEKTLRARVEKVLAEEWGNYEIRRDISASEMGAPMRSRGYSYGLFLNGQPKAMIMLLGDGSDYCKKDVTLAHEACQEKGVFCMNLLEHMPNRRSYISKRLKDNVK